MNAVVITGAVNLYICIHNLRTTTASITVSTRVARKCKDSAASYHMKAADKFLPCTTAFICGLFAPCSTNKSKEATGGNTRTTPLLLRVLK